jgi:sodium/pantothenate symporter
VLGLYWKHGNAYGALGSILTGVFSYIFIVNFFEGVFGMHSVVLPVFLSLIAYILFSLAGKNKRQAMQQQIIEKYLQ